MIHVQRIFIKLKIRKAMKSYEGKLRGNIKADETCILVL